MTVECILGVVDSDVKITIVIIVLCVAGKFHHPIAMGQYLVSDILYAAYRLKSNCYLK